MRVAAAAALASISARICSLAVREAVLFCGLPPWRELETRVWVVCGLVGVMGGVMGGECVRGDGWV